MSDTQTLTCPKCRGQMRSYERNGVVVDQCEDCRGIFLDQGELENLMRAGSSGGHDDERHGRRSLFRRGEGGEGDRKRSNPADMLSEFLGGGE